MIKHTICLLLLLFLFSSPVSAAYHFSQYKGRNPIHVYRISGALPQGISPDTIKSIYHLPASGGHGTVAIIGAYRDVTIEKDLNVFSQIFKLPACTIKNGCLTLRPLNSQVKTNSGWSLETALDVEWVHAIAPSAKILLVEASTPSGDNLLKAVDYAAKQPDVIAVSMSWGGKEFIEETSLDSHFTSPTGAVFFASSGDHGWGVSWPAASKNVVAVGGSSLSLKSDGSLNRETAWEGSGGGVSAYESEPSFQTAYSIPKSKGKRAIPDVAYDADPHSGFSVYSKGKWYVIGGTSAAAPQWAAIQSLGLSASAANLYSAKASGNNTTFFRDIISGANGECPYYCQARRRYDYVTGLGSPLTVNFTAD